MRKQAREISEDIRHGIRKSKHGLLKIVGIELLPIAWGASLGGIGRITGEPWIPAVPLVMDLIINAEGYTTSKGVANLIKYGLGVSLSYADKIYQTAIPLINNL